MPGGNVSFQGSSLKPSPRQLVRKIGEDKAAVATAPVRLWVKGVFTAYTGGKKNIYHKTAIIKIQDLNDKDDVPFYLGKRLAYIYKVKKADKFGSKFRVIWGRVCRAHGNNGAVRAKFRTNLPPKALGKQVRCMLYPSNV
ncbi:60S ribosomal protein L35a [Hondaea fermentalgiana]|uniref:60S ribosomal protein L35a n=1 Tax=Hondaea fermentalgiana TaxID=2315210 RepID=A0A2R5GYT5_9STRA|nr:60S ribosomal protein L35a [Hondaea fermentalgiana]|eukprot:GBG33631.1 60S ribosomal protein L35a [Hondaea fermentalgiana]